MLADKKKSQPVLPDQLDHDRPQKPRPRRLPAETRRQEIVVASFQLIATKGFEGLRMRDVASRVQINSATIHHYFPTKQHLIEGVAEYLAMQFAAVRAPAVEYAFDVPPSLRALRQEFADVLYCQQHLPELLTVSRELSLRATRDAAVAGVLAPLNTSWRLTIEQIIFGGQQSGAFRKDVVARDVSAMIVSALWGMNTLLRLTDVEYRDTCQTIEQMLMAPNESHTGAV